MGLVHKAPLREPYASDFRRFMFQYLQHHGLHSRTAHHIADNGWRESTGARYATCMRRWIQFCKETKKDKYDMKVDNCLEFFRFLDSKLKVPLSQLKLVHSFLSISRRLARKPYSDNEMILLKKYLNRVINERPHLVKKPCTSWRCGDIVKLFSKSPRQQIVALAYFGREGSPIDFTKHNLPQWRGHSFEVIPTRGVK